MNERFISIPFTFDEGIFQLNGIGKFSSAGVVLEFESWIFGIIKTGIKEVRVPIEEIEKIKLNKRWFKTTLEIWLNNFKTISEMPNKNGRIVLLITKEDRETARKAVQILEKSADEYKKEMPPPRTPVSSLFDENETSELNEK